MDSSHATHLCVGPGLKAPTRQTISQTFPPRTPRATRRVALTDPPTWPDAEMHLKAAPAAEKNKKKVNEKVSKLARSRPGLEVRNCILARDILSWPDAEMYLKAAPAAAVKKVAKLAHSQGWGFARTS